MMHDVCRKMMAALTMAANAVEEPRKIRPYNYKSKVSVDHMVNSRSFTDCNKRCRKQQSVDRHLKFGMDTFPKV